MSISTDDTKCIRVICTSFKPPDCTINLYLNSKTQKKVREPLSTGVLPVEGTLTLKSVKYLRKKENRESIYKE